MVWMIFFDMDFLVLWLEESKKAEIGHCDDLSIWKENLDDGYLSDLHSSIDDIQMDDM